MNDPAETAIRRRHLRAPQGDEESLIEPALNEVPALVARNRRGLGRSDSASIFGSPLADFRSEARVNLAAAARQYTSAYRDVSAPTFSPETNIVLAGHQPELFHPGVWLKNFVLSEIARQPNTLSINLTVDNDTAGSASIRIPAGSRENPHYEEVPIDEPGENIPFEERRIVSAQAVRDFAVRLRQKFDPSQWFKTGHSPALLVDQLWKYLELPKNGDTPFPLGETLARARHRLEQDFGLSTLELPLSHVVCTFEFRSFALHLFLNLPRLREVYNRSLDEYREVNKIRSYSHPVPALEAGADWFEAPFWIWTAENPRRQRLFVHQQHAANGEVTLKISNGNQQEWKLSGRESDFSLVEQWEALESRGVKIRPRALITTMYARLILRDLFIHGIGGAKYDELTDVIIRRFFHIEPPAYLTVTGTVRLPIDRPPVTADDLRREKRLLRDTEYRPEAFLGELAEPLRPEFAAASKQRDELLESRQFDFRRVPKETHHQLDTLRSDLANMLSGVRQSHAEKLAQTQQQLTHKKILGSREFSFVLFPADELPETLAKMATGPLSPKR
ncbi:hypothetical protein ETAA8_27920 [Anatilimnocola aggregata]|uniref:Uncharacterized protein n=1 Tax=Anatilimnocola aggregata TaxID=2528021 RepID=A0A517YBR9_9BACT|nr:hypothetical protein [Anatilimnocola aggregata]QDU27703.1 hypothetical protein ETAA8_27920 [Anatilimnocola aggregata]